MRSRDEIDSLSRLSALQPTWNPPTCTWKLNWVHIVLENALKVANSVVELSKLKYHRLNPLCPKPEPHPALSLRSRQG